jgi:hypothetical protein
LWLEYPEELAEPGVVVAGLRLRGLRRLGAPTLQPEGHAHVLIELAGHGQLSLSVLAWPCTLMQQAEPTMAVGDQGTHPELLGQSQRVTVAPLSLGELLAIRREIPQEAECPRLVSALLVGAGEVESLFRESTRLLRTSAPVCCLAEPGGP